MRRFKKLFYQILRVLAVYAAILAGVTAAYVFYTFGRISIEQISFVDDSVLRLPQVQKAVALIILISLALTFVIDYLAGKKIKLLITASLTVFFIYVFSLIEYTAFSFIHTDFYETEYKTVSAPDLSFGQHRRNLVIIYMESMERDYKGQNIKPYLDGLKKNHLYFDGFKQLSSTHMTLGAQFSSLCGIPLKKAKSNRDLMNFFPKAACIPDILKKAGYRLGYLKASNIKYSGADLFAKQHGFDIIKGYHELKNNLRNKYDNIEGNSFGGLRDEMLFEAAKDELKQLKEPFFLVLTTLDMHTFPEYFVDQNCPKKFGDIRDAVGCVDQKVESFMAWLEKQEFYANTTVILLGDHIDWTPYPRDAQIFNVIVNPSSGFAAKKHQWSTYDLAPTILNSIGVDIPALGLGRSLMKDEPTLLEEYGNNFGFYLMAKNRLFNQLAENPTLDYSFKPYRLGSLLTNNQTAQYADLGHEAWCYMTTIMSLNIGHQPTQDLLLTMDITTLAYPFGISVNGHLLYAHKERKPLKDKLSLRINKDWIAKDGNVILEIGFDDYNRNNPTGICIDNFVLN